MQTPSKLYFQKNNHHASFRFLFFLSFIISENGHLYDIDVRRANNKHLKRAIQRSVWKLPYIILKKCLFELKKMHHNY